MKKAIQILKTKTPFFAVLIFLLAISSSTYAQKQKRNVGDFTKISYSIPGTLEIVQADKVSLALDGDSDDLDRIITKVEGDRLKIYTKNNSNGLGDVKIYVSVVELSSVSVAGSGDVVVKSKLKTNELDLELSGSGNIKCEELIASEVEINLAGSGDVYLGGIADDELDVNIAGSGDVNAVNLKTKEADVNIAGSGSVKVWATDELESNIVGSGDVNYKGNPIVNAETVGSGKTRSIN